MHVGRAYPRVSRHNRRKRAAGFDRRSAPRQIERHAHRNQERPHRHGLPSLLRKYTAFEQRTAIASTLPQRIPRSKPENFQNFRQRFARGSQHTKPSLRAVGRSAAASAKVLRPLNPSLRGEATFRFPFFFAKGEAQHESFARKHTARGYRPASAVRPRRAGGCSCRQRGGRRESQLRSITTSYGASRVGRGLLRPLLLLARGGSALASGQKPSGLSSLRSS
jgi:hypothetical protein